VTASDKEQSRTLVDEPFSHPDAAQILMAVPIVVMKMTPSQMMVISPPRMMPIQA
jgi:hypothetical protein